MKKILLFIFTFLFICANAQDQNKTAKKISFSKTEADNYIGFDNSGNNYYIKDNILYKKNEIELWQYKNISLGRIKEVDIENPLKIVVFYEGFNSVVLLDNQLNEIQNINFSDNSFTIAASRIGIASQNQIWVYNSLDQQIGLYNYLKNTYRTVSTSFPENSKYIQSDFNNYHWIDVNNNWYRCDLFGKITLVYKIPNYEKIRIISTTEFIYFKDGRFYYQEISKNTKQQFEILEKTFENFYYKDQILAIFTSEGIINYKIITP